jgi:hypothetical protein
MIRRGGEGAIAVTQPWEGTYPSALIYVDIDFVNQYPYLLIPVVEHELGHAYGAEHKDGTLMQWDLNASHCIDKTTIEAVAKRLHLYPQYLNHCL